jgi:hypothetical protein
MLSRLLALVAFAFLSACGADHKWATDAEVAAVRVVAGPPATITLVTSVNGRSGAGAHSGLLINGAERVLYDPAGGWELLNGLAPERADLHYGMADGAFASYVKFQAEGVFTVTTQTVIVPQAVADQAIAEAIALGSAPKADCSHSISIILRKLAGFESVSGTFFPRGLYRDMAKVPGVMEQRIEDYQDGMAFIALNPSVTASAVTN